MRLLPTARPDVPFGSRNAPLSGRYELNGTPVPSVTEVLRDVGLGLDARPIPPEILHQKGRLGTIVHEEIERMMRTGFSWRLYEDRAMAYLASFREWFRKTEPFDVIACERSCVPSPRVAGTLDCLARRQTDGRWILYDWKTRETKRYDGYQLAGYLELASQDPEIPYRMDDVKDTDRVIVSLREWQPAREHFYHDPRDFEVFDSACVVWHARRSLE